MTRRSGRRPIVKRKIRTDMLVFLLFLHWKPWRTPCAVFVLFLLAANVSFAQRADKTSGLIVSGGPPRAAMNIHPTNSGPASRVSPNSAPSNAVTSASPSVATPRAAKLGAGINGTGIGRPGSGPGRIGGAATDAPAINGTSVRRLR
jgi:hypothetical protein